MKTTDYLKRAFSAAFHEEKGFRTFVAGSVATVALAMGYIDMTFEEHAQTAGVPAAEEAAAVKGYMAEIENFKSPDLSGEGWKKFEAAAKDFSRRVIMDPKLSENDARDIGLGFKSAVRIDLPTYLWLKESRNEKGEDFAPTMRYLEECRADIVPPPGALNAAEAVYACNLERARENGNWSFGPGVFGGALLWFVMVFGGANLGARWENEFNDKKRRERREKILVEKKPELVAPSLVPEPVAVIAEPPALPPVRKVQLPKFD